MSILRNRSPDGGDHDEEQQGPHPAPAEVPEMREAVLDSGNGGERMTRDRWQDIRTDIENAANTCNLAVQIVHDVGPVGGLNPMDQAMATALIGVGQALIAIAEAILGEEESNG